MNNQNISLNKNRTEVPKQETRRAKREITRKTGEPFVEEVVKVLEEQRRKRWKKYSIYTQEYVAEKAGISPSTYKGYIAGRSHNIDLITAKRIAEVLECRLSNIIEKAEH